MNESFDTILLNVGTLDLIRNLITRYKEFNLLVYFVHSYYMKMPSLFFVG